MKLFTEINPPHTTGVYFFKDKYEEIIYIGKAKNLYKRIFSYNTDKQIDWKISYLLEKSSSIEWINTINEHEALLLEAKLISAQKPLFNKLLTSNNPFYYVLFEESITPLPKITISRFLKKNISCSIGPFLKKKDAIKIQSLIIDFFNLHTCNKKIKQGCLHFHINKCSGNCKENFDKQNYIKRFKLGTIAIKNEENFFITIENEIKKAKKEFNIEMIEELLLYKENYIKTFYYIYNNTNNIYEEKDIEKILIQISLEKNEYQDGVKTLQKLFNLQIEPHIIDCVDISHIQGNYVTGACIRFENGEYNRKISNSYILNNEENNDYKNLILTIKKHYIDNQIALPDILLIDGGKGQLQTILNMKLNTCCIALAKKEEQLFFNNNKNITLNLHEYYAKLLIKIRNATHNAAIHLHKTIRKIK